MEPEWSYLIVACLVAEKELEGGWRIKCLSILTMGN